MQLYEFSDFIKGFKDLGTIILGTCVITALIFFIISLTKLAGSAGNEQARSKALKGILYSGIALGLFGGLTVVAGFFVGLIS